MTGKSKKRLPHEQSSISINGSVNGTGNVVGHGSSSNVHVVDSAADKPRSQPVPRQSASGRLMWVRLAAFLLALAGILATIAVFARLLQTVESWAVVQFALAAIVAALGISGTIKPHAVVDLLAKIIKKE